MNVSRKFFGFSDLCCHSGSVSVNLSCPLSHSTKGQGSLLVLRRVKSLGYCGSPSRKSTEWAPFFPASEKQSRNGDADTPRPLHVPGISQPDGHFPENYRHITAFLRVHRLVHRPWYLTCRASKAFYLRFYDLNKLKEKSKRNKSLELLK